MRDESHPRSPLPRPNAPRQTVSRISRQLFLRTSLPSTKNNPLRRTLGCTSTSLKESGGNTHPSFRSCNLCNNMCYTHLCIARSEHPLTGQSQAKTIGRGLRHTRRGQTSTGKLAGITSAIWAQSSASAAQGCPTNVKQMKEMMREW